MNWPQLQTILWLRWRLTRNQWAKGGGVGAVIAAIVAVGVLVLSAASFFAGIAVGGLVLGKVRPMVLMAVWLGITGVFLLVWMIGLITELQRSETIDLPRLMHLPVQLGQIFLVNYVASHLSVSVLLYVPASIGLGIGLAYSRGPLMLLMIPLALAMVFMVTSWTYLLRGWLATLMSNPRKRRTVIMALTAAFILIAQGPNIYFNLIQRIDRKAKTSATAEERKALQAQEMNTLQNLLKWQMAIPPLWVSAGARPLAEGNPFPAMLGFLGCASLGALGLRRAYTSTLRFYQGDSGGKASARLRQDSGGHAGAVTGTGDKTVPRAGGRRMLVERKPAFVPDESAAIGLATLQGMLRAPEVKMQWGTSFLITLVVGGPMLFKRSSDLPAAAGPFVATAVVVFSIFMMVAIVANQFGFDRDGFRAFVLSPVERWKILFGKNLAAFPAAAASSTILVTLISVFLRLSPLAYIAALLQLVVAVVCASMAGNLLSILVPYRVQPGSLKPTKMPALATLVFVVCQMSLPIALLPAFIPPLAGYLLQRWGYAPAGVVDLLLSGVFAGVMTFVYWQTLGPTGRLLQRRETKILQTVSESVE